MSGGKRKAVETAGQQQRPRTELKMIVCECDDAWRAAWPDLEECGFDGNKCTVGSRRLARAILRHRYTARADEKGRAPPDLAASNRFAAYGALAMTMSSEHKGCLLLALLCLLCCCNVCVGGGGGVEKIESVRIAMMVGNNVLLSCVVVYL